MRRGKTRTLGVRPLTPSAKRPFIPPDKPRSWVISVLATLIGFSAGLLIFILSMLGVELLIYMAEAFFVGCAVVAMGFWIVFAIRSLCGQYRHLEAKPWAKQKW